MLKPLGVVGLGAFGFGGLLLGLGVAEAQTTTTSEPEVEAQKEEQIANENGSKHPGLEDLRIFSGRANAPLAKEIADNLGVPLGKISIKAYADGEIGIQVHDNVRGKDVYIVQPTSPPGVNDNLMELILMISTMRRASARKITAIIPYYGYARQDRKMQSRVPISAADVARLLQSMGVDRVVAVDLHCGQIQGFFSPRCPCDNLEGFIVSLPYFAALGLESEHTKVVSPDAGGVYRAKRFRDGLRDHGIHAGLAMIVKQRQAANKIERMDLVGHVDGCDVIMVDDMIDTAGTLTKAAAELKRRGARRVFAFATHGLFSGPAYDNIKSSVIEKVVVLNTIPLRGTKEQQPHNIIQLSSALLLSEAIERIHLKKSVSALFDPHKVKGKKKKSGYLHEDDIE
jgi:ribose-phosphate pyrophosphokinase